MVPCRKDPVHLHFPPDCNEDGIIKKFEVVSFEIITKWMIDLTYLSNNF